MVLQVDVFEEAELLAFRFLDFRVGHDQVSDLTSVCVGLGRFFIEILHFFALCLKVEVDLLRGLRKVVVLLLGRFRCSLWVWLHVIWIEGLISVGVGVEAAGSCGVRARGSVCVVGARRDGVGF